LKNDTAQLIQSALSHHRAGREDQAEQLYRQVLEERPSDPYVLHSLGVIALGKGQVEQAAQLVRAAIGANPEVPQFHNTLGVILDHLGQPDEAIAALRQAISLKPDYAEACVNVAITLQTAGRFDEAIKVCLEALDMQPTYARAYHTMGFCLHALGRLGEAVGSYQKALALDPSLVEVYNQLGVVLSQQDRFDQAAAYLRQAVQRAPHYAEAHNNLGIALRALGHVDQAIECYKTAIALQPQFPEAHYNLAGAQASQGLRDQAIESCHRAIELRPDYAQAYNQLGIVLAARGDRTGAMECYLKAIGADGQRAEFYNNLAIVYKEQAQYPLAVQNYLKAVVLEPAFPEAHYNLANALKELGDCDRAIACYDQAIALRGNYADAHWNRALALLLKGDLKQGWREYQWRYKVNLDTVLYPHLFNRPRWQGEQISGRRLLVYCEQGLGDAIQFIRFVPQIRPLSGAEVILETWPPLIRLFQGISGVDRLVEASTQRHPEDDFDLCVSIMDLPYVLGASLDTIPRTVPYLTPDPAQVQAWRQRLAGTGLKVGIVWAGRPTHGNDLNRSCRWEQFAVLAKIQGVRLYGLQKGPVADQVPSPPPEAPFTNLGEGFADLMDAASCMAAMDLVISVDTAMAHLAGALGRPVWTLLPFAPDWRWMLHRDDSPWYPTMRLFRQPKPRDWGSVFASIAQQLAVLTSQSEK